MFSKRNFAATREPVNVKSLKVRIAQSSLVHKEIFLDNIKFPPCTFRAAKSLLCHRYQLEQNKNILGDVNKTGKKRFRY